jgi:hypothetical protein
MVKHFSNLGVILEIWTKLASVLDGGRYKMVESWQSIRLEIYFL